MKPVRVVYCVPSDVTPDPAYEAAINSAMLDLQKWFAGQLGGRTFTIFTPEVETFRLPQTAEYYSVESWDRIMVSVNNIFPFPHFNDFIWVLYADVVHACDAPGRLGAGWPGLCILPRQDMDGLVGRPYVDDCGKAWKSTPQQAVGGLGHELGHAFGLPHPPFCGTADESQCDWGALMYLGFHGYPDCHLTAADKAALLQHPAFTKEVILSDKIDFTENEGQQWDWDFEVVAGEPTIKVYDKTETGRTEIDFRKGVWPKTRFEFEVVNGQMAVEVHKRST